VAPVTELHDRATWLVATVALNPVGAAIGVPEASERGSVLLALEALGIIPDLEQAPDFIGAVYEPDPCIHLRYREAIARQKELYKKLVQ
jgi:hypothetical protein